MPTNDEVLSAIFDDPTVPLYAEFEGWMLGSRRFLAFATAYSQKIHSKLQKARSDESLQDVRAELETAALLLRDDRFRLDHDAYAAIDVRGPDFTVTFRGDTYFNVEVRRIRSGELGDDADTRNDKLMAMIVRKLGRFPTKIPNLLWIVAGDELSPADVVRAAQSVRQRAEANDDGYFAPKGYDSAADFLKQYRLLSGIVLHQRDANTIWLNELTRSSVPPAIVTAIQNLKPL